MSRTNQRSIVARSIVAAALLAAGLVAACSDSGDPVTPTRSPKTVTVSSAAGNGRVASSDGKLDCRIVNGATSGPTCSAMFDSGSVTTLTATADADHEFIAWVGDCSGSTACRLTVTWDATVSPRFAPLQGTVSLALTTPNADDGALIFTVAGPSILGVTPATGLELIESRATASGVTTSTILVRGNLASGTIGTLTVRGVNVDSPYTTQVREAAARQSGNYAQRSDLSQYRVAVQK